MSFVHSFPELQSFPSFDARGLDRRANAESSSQQSSGDGEALYGLEDSIMRMAGMDDPSPSHNSNAGFSKISLAPSEGHPLIRSVPTTYAPPGELPKPIGYEREQRLAGAPTPPPRADRASVWLAPESLRLSRLSQSARPNKPSCETLEEHEQLPVMARLRLARLMQALEYWHEDADRFQIIAKQMEACIERRDWTAKDSVNWRRCLRRYIHQEKERMLTYEDLIEVDGKLVFVGEML